MHPWSPLDLLPGLYVAGLLALGVAALRRWFDAVPWWIAGVFFAAAAMVLCGQLFAGGVMAPLGILSGFVPWKELGHPPATVGLHWDQVMQIVPTLHAVRGAIGAGEWPLWNPFAAAGMPLLADPLAQPFQPLVVAAAALPLAASLGVTGALRLLGAMVFTFLLLRRQRMGAPAALAGGLAFGLGGWMIGWLGWHEATVGACLPALLYALVLSDERGRRRDFALLVAVAATLLLAGHPETILYAALTGAAFALARLVVAARGRRPRLAARWTLSAAVALALTAPVLLPMASWLPRTDRALALETVREPRRAEGWWGMWGAEERRCEVAETVAGKRVAVAAPTVFGSGAFPGYWGPANALEDGSSFPGTAMLLAASLALWPGLRRLPQERFFLGLLLFVLLILARAPELLPLVERLPALDSSATRHLRMAMMGCFALVYLGAAACDRAWRGERPGRLAVTVVTAGALGFVVWAYAAHPPPAGVGADLEAARRLWRSQQLAAALLAGLALWLPHRRRLAGGVPAARPWSRWIAPGLFVLAVGGELLAFAVPDYPAAPKRLFYPENEVVRFLQQHLQRPGEPPADGAEALRMSGVGVAYPPNAAGIAGLPDIRYSEPTAPGLYSSLLRPLASRRSPLAGWAMPREHPLYTLLGVRYEVVPRGYPAPWRGRRVLRTPTTLIFRRPAPLPLAFLPKSSQSETPGGDWKRWLWQDRNLWRRSLVRGDAAGGPWQATVPKGSHLAHLRLGRSRIRLRAELAERRLLATSFGQDGGWRVLAGGRPVPTVLTNGPFIGAWLPPGRYAVELLYRPRPFVAGCLLCGLALAAGLAFTARPAHRDAAARRRS